MTNFIIFFRKPIVWIYVSVIYIWLLAIGMIVASLGPPFLVAKIADIDDSLSLAELKSAFMIYVQEMAKHLDISDKYLLYSILSSIILFTPVLIIGFFVLRKKLWARNALIVLLISYILRPVLIGAFTSETYRLDIGTMLIYLVMIYFFLKKSTKDYFLRESRESRVSSLDMKR